MDAPKSANRKWITRARPRIDRIACPWLIKRFIDPGAEILYAPAAAVRETAARTGATPFDIPDVAFGHRGDRCSFDAFIDAFKLDDPALARLALIVRAADTGHPEHDAAAPGLLAISDGLRASFSDDHAMLDRGMIVYDALYAWCRTQVGEGR